MLALRRLLFRFSQNDRGATAVEFAMILPAFVMLLFGIFEFSRLIFVSSSVQWATDRAARLAVLNPEVTVGVIESEIRENLKMANDPNIEVSLTTTSIGTVEIIHVTTHYEHYVSAPFVPSFTVAFDFETVIPKP
jgi:Flp pilus assembly protein TadG